MKKYNSLQIEKKWQKYWESKKLYEVQDTVAGKKNFYKLVEFPYPSGNLHMGHWYSFAVPDIFARYKRMQGYNVMYPIGFDAFGLPAENAAIKNNLQPADWTKKNIAMMTKQMKSMGTIFDWSRAVSTIDPEYYRWTQWIFLQFYKAGLAYRAKTLVNWCPSCKTVLANEQVVDSNCERCGSTVEQREREQWMYRITKYADQLLEGLDRVDWPEVTKTAQRNWIGRKDGLLIKHKIKDTDLEFETFTAYPAWIFADTFIAIAAEHPLVNKLIKGTEKEKEIHDFAEKIKKSHSGGAEQKANKEKEGIFTECYAVDPLTGDDMPIWIANFALMDFGTGIIRCSAHDPRDREFAYKYKIPLREVVERVNGELANAHEHGGKLKNSGSFNGKEITDVADEIMQWAEKEGFGKKHTSYRLRDWILSRQRYWGTPIPLIYCGKCAGNDELPARNATHSVAGGRMKNDEKNPGWIPVPEDQLPVKLPKLDNYLPADDGSSPLARAEKWVKTKCPQCGGEARRETDTVDTFVDSSWYFLRYTDSDNKQAFASKEKMKEWLPVDLYTGGAEHNTMHLLYSRFFIKALNELGFVDFNEPFTVRRNHGIVLGPDGAKMSKSKGNVIDPDQEVAQYGADAVRMYLAFLGPYDTFNGPWNSKGIIGLSRFLNRVWKLMQNVNLKVQNDNVKLQNVLHRAIKKVGEDIEALHFNTAISELMKLLNAFENSIKIDNLKFKIFLRLLAPFAPHLTEELWSHLGHKTSIHLESWPQYDPALIAEFTAHFAIQINGKTRAVIELPADSDEQSVRTAAQTDERIKRHLTGPVEKAIFVKGKLLNMVLRHI